VDETRKKSHFKVIRLLFEIVTIIGQQVQGGSDVCNFLFLSTISEELLLSQNTFCFGGG
jgi:hypothetical protein